MRSRFSERADKDYAGIPPTVTSAKQLDYLLKNLRHPSLRAKKFDVTENLWQARVDWNWRFYFKIEGDGAQSSRSFPHPK